MQGHYKETLYHYMNGLQPQICWWVQMPDPPLVDAAAVIAGWFESSHLNDAVSQCAAPPLIQNDRWGLAGISQCPLLQPSYQWSSAGPSPQKQMSNAGQPPPTTAQSIFVGRCFNCGELGHRAKGCPKPWDSHLCIVALKAKATVLES